MPRTTTAPRPRGKTTYHIHNCRNTHAPPQSRDGVLRFICAHGRQKWNGESGYHQRSLAETVVFRLKTLCGDHLSTRLLATHMTQFEACCSALNLMNHLGTPE